MLLLLLLLHQPLSDQLSEEAAATALPCRGRPALQAGHRSTQPIQPHDYLVPSCGHCPETLKKKLLQPNPATAKALNLIAALGMPSTVMLLLLLPQAAKLK